jgi:hypothetical protein
MTFASRNVVILAKIETTRGTYSSPASTDGVLIASDYSIRHRIGRADRDNLRPYMGGADQLNGFRYEEIEFTTELAGSGTAGTAPPWGKLARAMGFAETTVASTLVGYTPVSEAMESLSLSVFYGGVRLNLRGCVVSRAVINLGMNTVPSIRWTVIGVPRLSPDDGLIVTAAVTPTLTAWQQPRVVLTETGTQKLGLGTSFNAGTGNITGGTFYSTKGIVITVDNDVTARPFLGWAGDNCPIIDRSITAQVMFDLAAQERADFFAAAVANTYTSISLAHGGSSFPGGTIKVFAPRAGYVDPTNDDDAGLLLSGYQFNLLPNTGNDDFYLVAM